jgi:hypothetical protein
MAWLGDRLYFRGLAYICCIAIAPGEVTLLAQSPQQNQTASAPQGNLMNAEQLESLVAPIALYPDPLLAQVLAASTYPLEIVTADRWVKQNTNLQGKALVEAAAKQDWDPSVQALVVFPSVLQMMNQNLDWTTALGNAFLAQQADVMAAVQGMRMRAEQSGKLQSTPQQQVQTTTMNGQPTIVIQPANPQVIYVPSYDPAYVFGAAPAYYPYPYTGGVVAASAIAFGVGVAVGAIFNGCCGYGWGWGANWGGRSIYVNNNFFNYNRNTFVNRGNWGNSYRGNGQVAWNHNPRYRGSVPYSNRNVANRFNGGTGSLRPAQLPANMGNIRPPGSQGAANRLQGNVGGIGAGGRGGPGQLPSNAGAANRLGGGAIGGNRPPASVGSANRASQFGGGSKVVPGNRGGAFSGGNAGQARAFSNRGTSSMGGGGFRGGGFRGGGGFHAGGGFRGGGRRR